MKMIVTFEPVVPTNRLTIDGRNPEVNENFQDFVNQYLNYTTLYKEIVVKLHNRVSVNADLLRALTAQYLHGCAITFELKQTQYTYQVSNPSKLYIYKWTPFDFSKPIPSALAKYTFNYQGKRTTYLDAINSLPHLRYIPNEIWNAIDQYSQERIETCKKFNLGYYPYAEEWYKQLTKDALEQGVRVISPNKKTYYEATAELDFERTSRNFVLKKGLRPLTEDELIYLEKYAPAYGVEIPKLVTRINSRKTAHGWTQEPEYVVAPISEGEINRCIYDPRNNNQLPGFVRKTLMPKVQDATDKQLRDAYFNLIWIMRHANELPNKGLMPGWAMCPVCHEIYRESEGCDCGAQEPITFVSADNKFYSNAESFEDITLRELLY